MRSDFVHISRYSSRSPKRSRTSRVDWSRTYEGGDDEDCEAYFVAFMASRSSRYLNTKGAEMTYLESMIGPVS